MLTEFREVQKKKEEFLENYKPVRRAFEDFLKNGEKIEGKYAFLASWKIWSVLGPMLEIVGPSDRQDYLSSYKRETAIQLPEQTDQIPLSARTETVLYPEFTKYSDQVDKAVILVTVGSGPHGRVAILPPVWAFEQNMFPIESYLGTPQRLAEVIPLLPKA